MEDKPDLPPKRVSIWTVPSRVKDLYVALFAGQVTLAAVFIPVYFTLVSDANDPIAEAWRTGSATVLLAAGVSLVVCEWVYLYKEWRA